MSNPLQHVIDMVNILNHRSKHPYAGVIATVNLSDDIDIHHWWDKFLPAITDILAKRFSADIAKLSYDDLYCTPHLYARINRPRMTNVLNFVMLYDPRVDIYGLSRDLIQTLTDSLDVVIIGYAFNPYSDICRALADPSPAMVNTFHRVGENPDNCSDIKFTMTPLY